MSFLKDKKYRVIIQGCRTNQYEGEAIACALEKEGARACAEAPDIIVVVSCTITSAADGKCRKIIRRAKRENAGSALVLCGCYAQRLSEAERRELGVDIAVGNRLKYKIPLLLENWFEGKERSQLFAPDGDILSGHSWDKLLLDRPRLHTRAFLKIQDGCDHYCSYCIVPYVRGRPVFRDMDEVMDEAGRVAASGCQEIILTGIHLGLYRGLGRLVRLIDGVPGIKRIRFGSLEPFAVDEELLDALASSRKFCPHLHLPLQSGDDGVLEKMRRGYTTAEFAGIVALAREKLGGGVHLSTDLMTGFPGEDERAFENSLRFVREMGFGKIHVFPYSPRQGTAAAELRRPAQREVRERTARALALAAELHEKYASAWIGTEVQILAEESEGGVVRGLTPHFVRVLAAGTARRGSEFSVTPEEYVKETLTAGILGKNRPEVKFFGDFL